MKAVIKNEGKQVKIICPGCGHEHQIPIQKVYWCDHVWTFNGDVNNPTFTPSINIGYDQSEIAPEDRVPDYRCHFVITNGKISYCNDCTHALVGQQNIDLPKFEEPIY